MIAIIDYGMGNLRSVSKALERVGGEVCVTRDKKKIQDADKIVLPGVGAFPQCVENLKNYHLFDFLPSEIKRGKWFLGICLGFQLLFEESEEFGGAKGLGIIKGGVKSFVSEIINDQLSINHQLKIPHMGWNQVKKRGDPLLLRDVPDESFFYFVHSFYVDPQEKPYMGTVTDYGIPFCSSIERNNILACQFHPEKSQKGGLKVLQNFVELK